MLDHSDHLAGRLESCGRPLPGVDMRIVDADLQDVPPGEVGEVVVRGPSVMLGYWNQPELTAATIVDGWLRTGDAGRLDDQGYLTLVDRVKDMIVSGGENVYLAEVENALLEHPDVIQCAVIGVPDAVLGERVHAVIQLREGSLATEDHIIEHCVPLIANYKRPKSVDLRYTSLPLSGVGKILKSELRAPFWEGRNRLIGVTTLELYHCVDARSFRALWALEELGLPYQLHLLPFPPRELQPDYLELNPLGTVPLFIDGDVRMTESAAIPQYLATRYGPTPLALSVDEQDYGLWLDWLHRGEATLTFPQTIVLRYSQLEPAPDIQRVIDDYSRWFVSRLRHVTRALADREWLCADRFTIADISVGYSLMLAHATGLNVKFSPEVSAYWERLTARPAFRAAKFAQGSSSYNEVTLIT